MHTGAVHTDAIPPASQKPKPHSSTHLRVCQSDVSLIYVISHTPTLKPAQMFADSWSGQYPEFAAMYSADIAGVLPLSWPAEVRPVFTETALLGEALNSCSYSLSVILDVRICDLSSWNLVPAPFCLSTEGYPSPVFQISAGKKWSPWAKLIAMLDEHRRVRRRNHRVGQVQRT